VFFTYTCYCTTSFVYYIFNAFSLNLLLSEYSISLETLSLWCHSFMIFWLYCVWLDFLFQRLISLCNGRLASPTESVEIQFLCTLCGLMCTNPHLTNIFSDQQV
jgi:hypothetical protein